MPKILLPSNKKLSLLNLLSATFGILTKKKGDKFLVLIINDVEFSGNFTNPVYCCLGEWKHKEEIL